MGIGIIAVGFVAFVRCSDFIYNNISLFPIVVALMIICIGLLIVLNKVKQKYLIVSLILIGINLVVYFVFFKPKCNNSNIKVYIVFLF